MTILIKKAFVIDPNSTHHHKAVDILIEKGTIHSIGKNIKPTKGAKIIESSDLYVSPGWFDMQVHFCDPGMEHKEDLHSGIKAACAGGFTGVATSSATRPTVQSKSEIEYIKNKTKDAIVDVFPTGCISKDHQGKDLAELFDMRSSGAIAFSDDKKWIESGLLLRALLYAKNFGGLIMTHCDDPSISLDGKMNEGATSTRIGLKGIPTLSEEIIVARNIQLASYSEATIHLSSISTKKSVELIREAKKKKINVTASANAYSLVLDDSMLETFDTNFKVNPPLRSKEDIVALQKAIADGTIDCITSDHRPQDEESKKVEFDLAAFGMIGLETVFPLLNSNTTIALDDFIIANAINPRKILGIRIPTIKENEKANLTLFDPKAKWTFSEKKNFSKSKNTPFLETSFTGKVIGIVNNHKYYLNS